MVHQVRKMRSWEQLSEVFGICWCSEFLLLGENIVDFWDEVMVRVSQVKGRVRERTPLV